jgi:hypothetical protein
LITFLTVAAFGITFALADFNIDGAVAFVFLSCTFALGVTFLFSAALFSASARSLLILDCFGFSFGAFTAAFLLASAFLFSAALFSASARSLLILDCFGFSRNSFLVSIILDLVPDFF